MKGAPALSLPSSPKSSLPLRCCAGFMLPLISPQLVVMPLTHRTQEGQDMDEEARQTFRYLQYGTKAAVAFLLNLERKQGERKRP
mmetsp:Transcript_2354/g.7148  ORF Transcript_2354/g.7148 Transcript_2354/m.7148 type:complete len:85 (-) Transcript_2354:1489-1743(-)